MVGLLPPGDPKVGPPNEIFEAESEIFETKSKKFKAAYTEPDPLHLKVNKQTPKIKNGSMVTIDINRPSIICEYISRKKKGHETDLEMSPRPLGTTVFEEIYIRTMGK